jgi:hypothetical protein
MKKLIILLGLMLVVMFVNPALWLRHAKMEQFVNAILEPSLAGNGREPIKDKRLFKTGVYYDKLTSQEVEVIEERLRRNDFMYSETQAFADSIKKKYIFSGESEWYFKEVMVVFTIPRASDENTSEVRLYVTESGIEGFFLIPFGIYAYVRFRKNYEEYKKKRL